MIPATTVLLAAAGISSLLPVGVHSSSLKAGTVSFTAELTRDQARVFLTKMSITPESVCAAGVSGEQVTSLLQDAAETLDAITLSIEASDAAVTTARAALSSLRSQGSNGAGESALQQAEATLTAALAAQSLLWQGAFESTVAQLSESQRALLATMRSNARQNVPLEYRVIVRTKGEWADLKKALQGERARAACGLAPNADMQAAIAAAASDPAVSSARQRLESGLAVVRAAWEAPAQP